MAKNTLYDSTSVMYLLGAVLKEPHILGETRYILTTSDFVGMHQVVFNSIVELATDGFQNIKPQDIDINLKQYPNRYEIYKNENGFDFVSNVSSLIDATFDRSKFDHHYERVKKFTILRDFEKAGINTKEIYDPNVSILEEERENLKLNETQINDIFDRIRGRVNQVEDLNISKDMVKAQPIGQGLEELMEEIRSGQQVGFPLDGHIFNYATMGARLKRLYLYSAPTGHGKTRMMVGNACSLSMPYIEDGEIVIKDDLQKVVFIATEMDPDEIQTLVLAYVSGVNEEKILTNTMSYDESQLVLNALEIMKEYSGNFIIEKISDPSVATLRTKVLKYVIQNQIYHVFYDYIFMSPALSTEFKSNQRDDTSLMMMANTLKEIASDYGVFVFTGTQVNREWEKRHFRNENVIAGSKAIADKIDFGAVAIKVDEEEVEEIRELLRADGITEDPNVVIDIYKNRRSRIVNMKLYRVFDYGTCRTRDLMLTDTNYHKVHGIGSIEYGVKRKGLLEMVVDQNAN